MEWTKTVRGAVLLAAALAVVVVWHAASCGNSDNGPPTVSWSPEPVVKTASALEFVFTSGVVDSIGDVGRHCSLAIDPDDNNPGIAYYDATNERLKFAKYNGSTWDKVVVDDPANTNVGQWSISLAFDGDGCASISYYDVTNKALKWAWDQNDDGDFNDKWGPGNNIDEVRTLADNATDDFGGFNSHAIRRNIYTFTYAFAFYEKTDADLLYMVVIPWEEPWPWISGVAGVDTAGDVGSFCSLHFHSVQPTVSYYDLTNGRLKFAEYNGSTWDVEVVHDPDDNVGRFSNLDYDASGNASIAYRNVTKTDPWWAWWDPVEEEWDWEALVVMEDEDWGCNMSHQWYSSTKCGFAFEAGEEDGNHLKFVRMTSGEKTIYTADNTFNCGDAASMAWVMGGDYRGQVWISHRDFENDDLRWTRGVEIEVP